MVFAIVGGLLLKKNFRLMKKVKYLPYVYLKPNSKKFENLPLKWSCVSIAKVNCLFELGERRSTLTYLNLHSPSTTLLPDPAVGCSLVLSWPV